MKEQEVPDVSETIRVGQLEIRYLQEGDERCQIGCFEMRVPPGSNVPPPHSHAGNEELIYVLEGTLRCTVGGETRDLTAGQVIGTPRGVVHAFSNPHATPVRALVMNTPGIEAQYFRDVGAVINAGGPPDRDKLIETMGRYGLALARPSTPPAVNSGTGGSM